MDMKKKCFVSCSHTNNCPFNTL